VPGEPQRFYLPQRNTTVHGSMALLERLVPITCAI
jgi:hypothetical protein